MTEAREAGMTLQAMANTLGVTRQRVSDILRERRG
jgi:plasmid maintenance system antidote protein VapI